MTRRRAKGLALAGLALLAILLGLGLLGSGSTGAVTSNQAEIKRQLLGRLHDHLLEPLTVVCLPSGRDFEGAAVIRCNVDYGDPHVEAVCAVLRGGDLVTNLDDGAIPCGPDLAGKPTIIETY